MVREVKAPEPAAASDEGLHDCEEAFPVSDNPPKLAQTEAIMEAIIMSKKTINLGDDRGAGADGIEIWFKRITDRLVPYWWCRWTSVSWIMAALAVRIIMIERHFFATYVLAIYLLNQLLLFMSPATEDDHLPMAPTGGEFRPFIRALSEFKLWCRGIVATAVTIVATFVDDVDLDVDGRALALYFVLLFLYTMKQQIVHMYQFGYVPWNSSKSRSKGKMKGETFDV